MGRAFNTHATLLLAIWLSVPTVVDGQQPRAARIRPEARVQGESDGGAILFASATGVLSTPSGQLIVADGISKRIVLLSPTGTLLRAVGRHGSGPGEFLNIAWLGRCGTNRVYVHDPSASRITVYDDTLQYVGSFQFAQAVYRLACDPRGAIAAARPVRSRIDGRDGVSTMRFQVTQSQPPFDSSALMLADTLLLGEVLVMNPGIIPRPLGMVAHLTSIGDQIVAYEETDRLARLLYFSSGRVRVVSLAITRRAATPGDVAVAIENIVAQVPAAYQETTRSFARSARMPERLPRVFALLPNDGDGTWIVTSSPSDADTELALVTGRGDIGRRLLLEGRVTNISLTGRRAVGVTADEDGLPSIVVYSLPRL